MTLQCSKEGQKATITLGDNTYQGTLTKINKVAIPNGEGTPMIGATVKIDNPDENIFYRCGSKSYRPGRICRQCTGGSG